jgi:hypothetical protein
VVHLSSGDQVGPVSTPIGVPTPGYLSITPWQSPPTYAVYAEVTKDGRKMLLKLAKDNDYVTMWLKAHVGSLVVIYVQQLGVAWTSTLSYNKRWKFLYVRIPSRPTSLKRLFEPLWKAGYPIPVVVSIPPIPTTPLKDGLKSLRGDAPASLGSNRGAPGDQAVRSPSSQEGWEHE